MVAASGEVWVAKDWWVGTGSMGLNDKLAAFALFGALLCLVVEGITFVISIR